MQANDLTTHDHVCLVAVIKAACLEKMFLLSFQNYRHFVPAQDASY